MQSILQFSCGCDASCVIRSFCPLCVTGLPLQEAYTLSYDERSKEMRNTVLALLLFLVEDSKFCHCVNSCGLTNLLAKVACAHDMASPTSLGITPFAMKADDSCHEQVQLLWRILVCMCERSCESKVQILNLNFMRIILQYIQTDPKNMPVRLCDP